MYLRPTTVCLECRRTTNFRSGEISLRNLVFADLEIAQGGIEVVVAHQVLQVYWVAIGIGEPGGVDMPQLVRMNVLKLQLPAPGCQRVLDRPC